MKKTPVTPTDLRGVFAVPPLSRKNGAERSIDIEQNDAVARHIAGGGVTRLLYGGNAFLYHLTLREFEQLLGWLNDFDDGLWTIPSVGPSYGRAMDQAPLLRRYDFPCAMFLPCGDPRDAAGLERGYREFADAARTKLIVYLKEEDNFGANREAGLDAVARLVDDGVCVGIKYAVVRDDPRQDDYLAALLARVDRNLVISGIGERPAVVHMRDWQLPGFTTGSGCLAPRSSQRIYEACAAGDFEIGEKLRAHFIPHEDLRDAWGPARVLHCATEAAGVARTGPVPPYLSPLTEEQQTKVATVAKELVGQERGATAG